MKTKLTNFVLMLFTAGLMAAGMASCATPAVKKPDIKKPTNTQGSQSSTTASSSAGTTTTKPRANAQMQSPVANQYNDSIVVIDSAAVQRKAP
jgi:hypothetical protein